MLRSRFTRLARWLAILTGITLLSFSCLLLLEAPTYSRDQNLILASQSLQLTPSELSQLSLKDSSNYLTLQAPLYSTSYHRSNNELDVVISYHTESLSVLKATITSIVAFLKDSDPRFIIYNKNSKIDSKKLLQATGADAVISLENVGREGQTYLRHILDHYDSSTGGEDHSSGGRGPLSSKTLFMQPHIEWVLENRAVGVRWSGNELWPVLSNRAPYVNVPLKGGRFPYLARQRLASMKSDTGFMNLAGFSVSFCGRWVRRWLLLGEESMEAWLTSFGSTNLSLQLFRWRKAVAAIEKHLWAHSWKRVSSWRLRGESKVYFPLTL